MEDRQAMRTPFMTMPTFVAVAAFSLATTACSVRHLPPISAPVSNRGGELSAPEMSSISLSVHFDIAPAVTALESVVPKRANMFGPGHSANDRPPENSKWWLKVSDNPRTELRYRVERDPFKVALSGSDLRVITTIRYALRVRVNFVAWWNASCGCQGEPWCNRHKDDENASRRTIPIVIDSPISLTPEWRVISNFAVDAAPGDRCIISPGGLESRDVTDQAVSVIREPLNASAKDLDRFVVEHGDLRSLAARAWDMLRNPIPIDAERHLWLQVDPQSAGVATLQGSGTQLAFTVTIAGRPQVLESLSPAAVGPDLPPLGTSKVSDQGFHVAVPVDVLFTEFENRVRRELVGKTLAVPGHTLRVRNISLYPSSENIVAAIDVDGEVVGRIYAQGTPSYDPNSRELQIDNFDYTQDTRNVLVDLYDWIGHSQIRERIASSLHWGLGSRIDNLTVRLAAALNQTQSNVRLTGTVSDLRLIGVTLDDTAVRVLFVTNGAVRLDIVQ
jgi:uncharacterized protein DUF4403